VQWLRGVFFRQYHWHATLLMFTDGRLYIAFPKRRHQMAIRSWADYRETTINDPEYYTESWTVLMNIPWADGRQISAYAAGKTTAVYISGK
jgi:hypothetical protein